jgi:hypothetical protein
MKFASLVPLALLAGGAFGSVLNKKDAKPVVEALGTISKAVKGLTTSFAKWEGDVNEGAQLVLQAQDILEIIEKASKTIEPIQPLALVDAVNILKPGNELVTDVQKVVETLISKKPAVDKNQLGPIVKDILIKFKTAAAGAIKVITPKLPANVATVGDTIGKQIAVALDKGLAAYS